MKYLLIFLVSTTFYISSYGQIIDTSFWDTNHDVKCFHAKGDTLFVGGSFSFVGEVNGGLLPIDIESGELVENFKRLEANITSIIPDLSGGWYIGGFTAIDTGSIANKYFPFIKHVLPDFSIDPDFSFGLSEFDYGAYSLRLWNNKLIVGGDFESIEGIFCKNLAIINTLTYEIGTFSHIPNDIINDLEISNDTIYIAGNFTQMGSAQRRGLAAFKLTTNELLDFNPNINSSQYSINVNVLSAIAIGSKLYIGGRFDSIGGIFQKNFGIVNRISGANLGTSICTDNDQNSFVKTIAIYGDTLIIGGRFDSVLNHSRYTAAAINLTNETLITSFPEFEADYFNEVTSVYKNNSNLYIAGLFRAVEDADRSNIALIDYNSFSILPWNPGVGGKVHSLAGNESILMIGGFFHTSFGEIRECIAAFNLNTSDLLPLKFYFTDLIGAPIVNGIDILDNTLYFGGKFQSVNGIDRSNAAAVDLNDGSVNNWDPSVYSFVRVLKTSVNVVYIGGIFNHVGGEPRTALAAIDAISGQVTAWNPNLQTTLSYPIVNDIEIFDDIIYIGGSFKQVNEVSRNCFAAINTNTAELEDWSPAPEDEVFDVYSIEISDDWLMIGGYFN
ncbi:MAG: hypothetical protein K8R74_08790, partial [Bacteroidales bacterium]|nr:hypothetical protein [Bacteroidales bacterium]